MKVISQADILDKKVLLRYDIDVPLGKLIDYSLQSTAKKGVVGSQKEEDLIVTENFRLKAGLHTLQLCLESAEQVTLIGHIGRPEGVPVPELSIAPILKWFEENGFKDYLINGQLRILENLRFDPREDLADISFAKELAEGQDIFINEAFAAYRPSASTTVLPALLPHFAGINFAREVETLKKVRENPEKPLVVIMGGAKVQDKLPVITEMAKVADAVLVGGKLASELSSSGAIAQVGDNVLVGMLNQGGTDMAGETILGWKNLIQKAKMIVWNGPVGKIESQESRVKSQDLWSAQGTYDLANIILNTSAQVVIGGGDTVSFLGDAGLFEEFQQKEKIFISTGGGAMLKFLSDGTLPTIEVLDSPYSP